METIRQYLEGMFAQMPNTPAVKRAKDELLQMMEDKYNELKDEGLSENAAIGTVISEFGNLDELAKDLGVEAEVKQEREYQQTGNRRFVSLDEVKAYLECQRKSAVYVAIGVLLCINCVCPCIFFDNMLGVTLMFTLIAVAVGIFIFRHQQEAEYHYIGHMPCQIDMGTWNYVTDANHTFKPTYTVWLTIGVLLCMICWLPCAILDETRGLEDYSGAFLFITLGIGVFCLVYCQTIKDSYEKILKLNDSQTVSGNYKAKDRYISQPAAKIMEVYWPTITCVYFIWSFLTFDWYITWVIWPIAGIIHKVLKMNLVAEE